MCEVMMPDCKTPHPSNSRAGILDDPGAWSPDAVVLDGDPAAAAPGEVLGVGEPSIATVDGRRELFFVVVQVAADGTLDLDVGRVRER